MLEPPPIRAENFVDSQSVHYNCYNVNGLQRFELNSIRLKCIWGISISYAMLMMVYYSPSNIFLGIKDGIPKKFASLIARMLQRKVKERLSAKEGTDIANVQLTPT